MDIRRPHPDEYAALREVRLQALGYSPHLAEHLTREQAAGDDFWRERTQNGAAGIEMVTFVAAGEGPFAAIADGFLSESGKMVEIGGVWVSEDHRRSGLAHGLIDALCEWGRTRGAKKAGLWVRAVNEPGQRLFESAGFEVTDRSGEGDSAGFRLERTL